MPRSLSSHSAGQTGATRAALAVALLAVAGAASSAQVSFRATTDDTFKQMSRVELRAAASEVIVNPSKSHTVVSFARPLADAEKADLAAKGLTLLSYLGGNNWTATLAPDADAAAVVSSDALVNLRPIDPNWKLEASLFAGTPPEWTIIDEGDDAADEVEIPRVADEKTDPLVAVYINFHADVSLARTARDILADLKIDARSYIDSTNLVVAHARLGQIRELVQRDEVLWVEPAEPKWSTLNNSNRERTQVNTVNAAPYGLTGLGVNVMVYDGGTVRQSHETFRGDSGQRVTIGDTDGVSDHANHVAGTIAGRGQADGNHRGMAPDAHILSYGFEVPGGLSAGFLYTDPGDLNADYGHAINTLGAHLSNNSIGSNTAPNGFPCEWEGNYGNTAALIDSIARGSLGRNMIMIWAAGNERTGSGRCNGPQGYFTSAPPGNAKNHITVGALNSNDDSITSFTSFGPDDAGRMRPDISAPGCQNGADSEGPNDNGVTSSGSSSNTTFNTKCGTSMAAPTVAGAVALLLQDWRLQFSGEPDPNPATVKTLLAHNAEDIAQPGPDNRTGYGSVRIQDTIDFMRTGNFAEAEVSQGGQYSVLVFVSPGDTEFKATIAWDDAPASPFASPTLVNDLDLVVIDPNGNRQYPWTLNATSPWENAVRTQPNTLDNIEQVFVENPTPGVWQVSIVGTNVPVGPQSVSLAASPLLINCSTAGIASLDSQVYSCGEELAIRVSDCDLNMDDDEIETVVVLVTSDSDPVGKMVLLTETGPLTADFRATLPTSTTGSAGVLQAQHGDTITLTYLDEDDGFGNTDVVVTATATVDCLPPVVSDLAVAPGTFDAAVTLTTDEPARVTVNFGETCGNLDRSVTGPLGTDHALTLAGLFDGTQYFFDVSAADPAGNSVAMDNGGVCYSFTTEDIPTYFVEQFNTSNAVDLNEIQLSFTPVSGSIDFYAGCAQDLFDFEIDPAGGTILPLNTNNSVLVNLADGQTVSLYGESYSSFWVNATGNITFNSADSDTVESISDQFAQPRVSALFDGLNSGAGTVSWKQTDSAVAVTWENIADNFTSGTDLTFQIVMHFNGRIDLNYLTMIANDGIAGLSPGGGTPMGFIQTDLTTLGSCGPQPPFANGASFQIPANGENTLALPGGDDGLPEPAMLTYIIETLPPNGRLFDSTNTQITSAPAVLPNETVTYRPNFNYLGTDSFTYSLDDGGTPPEGGPSNIATVNVTIGGPTPIHTENFDTDPGWSTEGAWAFGQPTGQGSRGGDPTSGFTGQFVYGYNLNGDYTNNMPQRFLTTPGFDCSGVSGVSVSFYRWLGVERNVHDKARFEVSNDAGQSWTVLFENPNSAALDETAWTQHTYDIAAIADGQPDVRFRWVMGTTDSIVVYHGWNIDDFVISAIVPLPECTGDSNGDGVVNFADLNNVLGTFGQSGEGLPGDVNGDGFVNFEDLNTVLANFGVDCAAG